MFHPHLPNSLLLVVTAALSIATTPGPAEKQPVTDIYHGEQITEDYRWLEDGNSAETKAWIAAQNAHTQKYLADLPERDLIASKLKALYDKKSPSYTYVVPRAGRVFAMKSQPPKQQRLLVTVDPFDLKTEKVVLDPNELAPKGQVAIDWFVPSHDGKLVAVCLSENGSEAGTLHFYEPETSRALPDKLERVQFPTGGGSAAWLLDGQTILYTRYPAPGERSAEDQRFYEQVYRHRLGQPQSADTHELGRGFPRIAEIFLTTARTGGKVLANVLNGDGGEHAHYLFDGEKWRQISGFQDGVKAAEFSRDGKSLFLRSVKNAPRGQILHLPLEGAPALDQAKVVVPQSEAVIEDFTATAGSLYVADLIGGPSRLRSFDLNGANGRVLPLAQNAGIMQTAAPAEGLEDDRLLFLESSFTAPNAWYLYDPEPDRVRRTLLASTAPVDFSDIVVAREFAVSKDGTKVPVNILHRRGLKRDGRNPTLLNGYGGYSISLRPEFEFYMRLWFDRGGVYAIANLRGGGEYGEEWHLAGNLTHKQNVFDDFAASARHLIEQKYTRPEKLAIEGWSNGGLLMGALLTQHPKLVRGVVSHVGIYDMLRVELDPNGAFNVTEFGTVKDPAQYRALRAYSPYHQVRDGEKYPAILMLAGEHDGRVNPAHSRKMTARVQAASASGRPVLLLQSSDSGHGMGTALSAQIAEQANVFAFLFEQLEMNRELGF